jgi:hypothetical protein
MKFLNIDVKGAHFLLEWCSSEGAEGMMVDSISITPSARIALSQLFQSGNRRQSREPEKEIAGQGPRLGARDAGGPNNEKSTLVDRRWFRHRTPVDAWWYSGKENPE